MFKQSIWLLTDDNVNIEAGEIKPVHQLLKCNNYNIKYFNSSRQMEKLLKSPVQEHLFVRFPQKDQQTMLENVFPIINTFNCSSLIKLKHINPNITHIQTSTQAHIN